MFTFQAGRKNCVSIYFGVKDIAPETENNKMHSATACGMNTGLVIIRTRVFIKSEKKTYVASDIIALKAVSHVINSRALNGEKLCTNKAIHALLMRGYATFNMIVPGHRYGAVTRCVLPCPRTSIVCGNYVCETSVKTQNKIVEK